MLHAVRRTAVWRAARGVKRGLLPPRCDEVLPAEQCRSAISLVDPPVALAAGQAFDVRVRVANRAGVPWATAGANPVTLGWRWLTPQGVAFADGPAGDAPLTHPVFPGEPAEVVARITAPAFVGDFTLNVDLSQAGEPFAARCPDAVSASAAVPVVGRRDTDIDYHAVYRTADLDANHWWVVGAYHSKEQYEQSSRDRLSMLVKHGLHPDSRVLDVGCGTGQMAGALVPYLSDRGAYYGTDIGAEAIAFCDRTFRRRRFAFRVGGMTHVPFDAADGPFDIAIFFSVFTHTFADETALLLAEASRLLADSGSIIADVIVSPLVERGAGHRGEMVLNRGHFERLAGMLNLSGDVIGRWPWNRHAERLMYRLRRAT